MRPLAAFEAMSGVCFSALTVVPPMLQEGWCLCDGELSDLFEAMSLSVSMSGAESTHAEGHEQVHDQEQGQGQQQRVGHGEKEYERDTVGGREGKGTSIHHHHHSDDQPVEGGSLRKPLVPVPVQMKGLSSAALQALDIVRLYL